MRILLLTENWKDEKGGIQDYLENIVKYLDGVRVFQVKRGKYWLRPRWYWIARGLRRRIKEEEIQVLLCGKALFEGRVGRYLKKKTGLPYGVFTYAMEIETWAGRRKERRDLIKVMIDANWIFYINEKTKKTLMELGAKEEQLVKLWPGASDRYFNETAPELVEATIKHYGLRRPYILCVGRLIVRKGMDTLIEAFAGLDQTKYGEWNLVIAGDGPELGQLKETAAQEYVVKSVKFLSNVPDKHLPALYAGAEFFALTPREMPGDYEGFGIVYIEAAASGLPAVGTKTGGVPEAVVNGQTGWLADGGNAADIKKMLELMIQNESERKWMGKAARERARGEFKWSQRIIPLVKKITPPVS